MLLIDLQNDFFNTIPNAKKIVRPVNTLVKYALRQKWLIIASRDWHSPELFLKNPEKSHCVKNSHGAEFYPELNMKKVQYLISKGEFDVSDRHYSAFNGETIFLLDLLQKHQIGDIVVAGLTTNYCVKYTVLDAIKYGFKVTIVTDGCCGINKTPTSTAESIEAMKNAGAITITSNLFNLEKK